MPIAPAIIGAAAAAVGAAASVAGAVGNARAQAQQADAQRQAAEHNRQTAERNKAIAEKKHALILEQAQKNVADKRRANLRIMSQIRANYGASGLAMSGTPLDVLRDSWRELELGAIRIEEEGQIAAWESTLRILGIEDEAALHEISVRSASARASAAGTAGVLGAIGAAASGAANVIGILYR